MEIEKKLNKEITDYCKANNLQKGDFINRLLKKAFLLEKYGEKPFQKNEAIDDIKNEYKTEKDKDKITEEKPIQELKIETEEPKIENIIEKKCIFDKEETTSVQKEVKNKKRVLT